jgi:hypothetical protein
VRVSSIHTTESRKVKGPPQAAAHLRRTHARTQTEMGGAKVTDGPLWRPLTHIIVVVLVCFTWLALPPTCTVITVVSFFSFFVFYSSDELGPFGQNCKIV